MLRRFFVVTMIMALALSMLTSKLEAANPGGNNIFSARVFVYDQDNNPYQGIPLKLDVQTTGPWGPNICIQNGTTDSQGWAYLECQVDPNYSETLDLMVVTMTNTAYAIGSSQNTSTSSYASIYPFFTIGLDVNENDVVDAWEMPLARKFCPVLFAPLKDNGGAWNAPGWDYTLRPIPVEAMDTNGDGVLNANDVYVDVYNVAKTQFVGRWKMNQLTVQGQPYSNRYPDAIKPSDVLTFQPPGKANGPYAVLSHYEWATTDDHEGNTSWYGKWNALYYQKGFLENDTWYADGAIYAYFENVGITRIFYGLHYPFNASSNRHEGDWPFIVVELDSQDPDNANIISVRFPFHAVGTVRTTAVTFSNSAAEALYQEVFDDDGNANPAFANKYFVMGGTHPVTFGGGRMDEQGYEGWGSHAQYPCPGIWKRHKGPGGIITLEEYVVENGSVSNETLFFDYNNFQNIRILPPRQYIVDHLKNDPAYNWVIFGGFWGGVFSFPSVDQGTVSDIANLLGDIITVVFFATPPLVFPNAFPFVPDINIAPLSPYGGSLGW